MNQVRSIRVQRTEGKGGCAMDEAMQWCEKLGAREQQAWQGLFKRIDYRFGRLPIRQRM